MKNNEKRNEVRLRRKWRIKEKEQHKKMKKKKELGGKRKNIKEEKNSM